MAFLNHASSRGVLVVLLDGFDARDYLAAVQRYKATIAMLVPQILLSLVQGPGRVPKKSKFCSRTHADITPDTTKYDLRSLATVLSGPNSDDMDLPTAGAVTGTSLVGLDAEPPVLFRLRDMHHA